jgi:quinol monooxygenase YgiN
MATTPVTLKIDGFKDREVAAVTYSFNQEIDKENQTVGIPRGGIIVVRVKAMNDGNVDLLKWMTSKTLAKKGSIVFMVSSDADKKMKSVDFEGAYCVDFVEHWEDKQADDKGTLAHWEEIKISCKKIVNGPISYENEWK